MNLYVAFEGIEGAGKSTVARVFAERLEAEGEPVVFVREPGGSDVGERIRAVLLDPGGKIQPWAEALLFAAARAELVRNTVMPALEEGSWVVSDRSAYSSLAYQGAGRGLGIEPVRTVNDLAIGGRWPDVVVLLRIDAGLGLDRQRDPDRIGSEGLEFQHLVSDAFDRLAAADVGRFVVVDAAGPLEEIVEEVWEQIQRLMRPSRTS